MLLGERITLTSRLQGFDGYELKYVWECDKGEGFAPVENGDSEDYAYIATAESLTWRWRLKVLYR